MKKIVNLKSVKFVLFSVLFMLFVLPKTAEAYLDPGSASYLFQILIAGALGCLFYIKSIIRWFKNIFKKDAPEND